MLVRRLLDLPRGFDLYQRAVGAHRSKRRFVRERVRLRPGERVLDVGCGTGALLEHFPDGVHYVGVDVSPEYVAAARRRYGQRGEFVCADVTEAEPPGGPFDLAITYGVLHHLDDEEVRRTLAGVRRVLASEGRLVAAEPCRTPEQGRVESLLMAGDRGRFIRSAAEYVRLAEESFADVTAEFARGELRIPYTLVVLEARPA